MSKFSLLNNLSGVETRKIEESKKSKYQVYSVELGFEKFNVCIPLSESEIFEKELKEMTELTNYTIKKIAKKFNGFIQE